MEMVKEGLKRINPEKKDFEDLKNKLSNMLLGESQTDTAEEVLEQPEQEATETPTPTPTSEPLDTSLPEPPGSSPESPVVVYVKNVDKPNP